MIRTLTSTKTVTKTITRIGALKCTVRAILNEAWADKLTNEGLAKLIETGLEERLIEQVDLWAKDKQGLTHGSYSLVIDYKALDMAKLIEPYFSFDSLLMKDFLQSENMPGEYRLELTNFVRQTQKLDLSVEGTVQLMPGIDREAAMKKLGLVPADEIKWATGRFDTRSVKSALLTESQLNLKFIRREGIG